MIPDATFDAESGDNTMDTSFSEHRKVLYGIAYRMLGSVADAEDMVQETWLRWQRQDSADIESPRAWMVAAITRLCIDQLRSARRQREEYYGVWLPEPLMETAPSPADSAELADSLTMAFMLMLERLSPLERAVFLLRDIFDYEYKEIAAIVGKSEANCRQIVSRAKTGLPGVSALPAAPTGQARDIVGQFLRATATGEMDDLLALLAEDATLYSDGGGRVTAAGRPIVSADHIARFLLGIRRKHGGAFEYEPVTINGCPGALARAGGQLDSALSFQIQDGRIRNIYLVRNPDKLRHLSTGSSSTESP
ncbi:MAG TPA: RNA polymerase sigma-70 factor [Verrucomicrobiales bacterium]|nr:RNA polymerase sigma-70 factor [Verrucomicrobiales bacterium]